MSMRIGRQRVLFGNKRSITKGSRKHKLLTDINNKGDWILKPHRYSETYNQTYVKACKDLGLIQERKFSEDKRKYQLKITAKGKKALNMLNKL